MPKVILLGIGRLQEDFEYIFDNININITSYIDLKDSNLETYNNKTCYNFCDIKNIKLGNSVIIVCTRK